MGHLRLVVSVIGLWWLCLEVVVAETAGNTTHAVAAQETEQSSSAAASGDELTRIDVFEYVVSGNTLLSRIEVERALMPYLGPARSVADIEAARVNLEQRYRDAGYLSVLVNIPEQEVAAGIVHLQVVEGELDGVRVTGSRYFRPSAIRAMIGAATPGEVMHMPGVQTQLNQLNSLSADLAVTPVLRPGRTPGSMEFELRIKDELPLHGNVEVNNQSSQNTTDLRAGGSVRYANLWQRAHGISLSYQTSPEDTDEVSVWSGTYNWRLGNGGKNMLAYAVSSKSSTAALGDLTVIGSGEIFGLRLMSPFGVSAAGYGSLSSGMEYKNFGETVELLGADSYQTPIDYVGFSIQYDTARRNDSNATLINIGSYFGVRGLGNTTEEFENKRFNAAPNYFYLRGYLEHTRELPALLKSVWRLGGQWSASPLISNEQFSAGGANSVRGYYESQALGDSGIQVSVELYSAPLAQQGGGQPRDFRALIFADAATLHINKALPGQDANHDLAGMGLGLRLSMWRTLNARLDWGWAMIEAGEVDRGDDRLHFAVDYSF